MTNNLRFPPAPRHSAEDDFLEQLGPAWSKMSTEEKRLYGGPITLAREAAEDAVTAAIAEGRGITAECVRDLLDTATRFLTLPETKGCSTSLRSGARVKTLLRWRLCSTARP